MTNDNIDLSVIDDDNIVSDETEYSDEDIETITERDNIEDSDSCNVLDDTSDNKLPDDDRIIDKILSKSFNIGKVSFEVIDIIFMICIIALGLIVRIKLYPIESADYWGFLEKWMNDIKELGGFASLGTKISNYTSPYMYLMCLVSGFDNSLYALKTISVIFDYSAAFAVFSIVHAITQSSKKSIIGMSFLLMSPTVFIDSAYWCQCDVIYTSFILWALYFFFKNNSKWCMIFIGIAFAFKLQTLFVVPFLIIMWLKKRTIKLLDFVYVPAVYIIAQLPAWMMGRPFSDLMLVYFDQSGYYPWGTLEYPNIYALLDETIESSHHMYEITGAGSFVTIAILGILAYYIYSKNVKIDNNTAILIALFSVAIIVYTLPHMHDRYGFLIDLLAILYAVINVRKIFVLCGFSVVSILTFMPYLIAVSIFNIRIVALMQLGIIVYVGYDMYKSINNCEEIKPREVI